MAEFWAGVHFLLFGSETPPALDCDVENKHNKFKYICRKIHRTLKY